MTLLELTEPIFQYICRLNRAARKAGGTTVGTGNTSFFAKPAAAGAASPAPSRPMSLDYAVVRAEIKALLDDLQQKAASDARLSSQGKKIELPLTFFIDSMIAESTLP